MEADEEIGRVDRVYWDVEGALISPQGRYQADTI
jgi:hypothetical protein